MFVHSYLNLDLVVWFTTAYRLALLTVNFIPFAYFILAFVKFGLLYSPLGYMFKQIIFFRVERCKQLVRTCKTTSTRSIGSLAIARFVRFQVATLMWILDSNKLFGSLLVAFLLGHVPLSGTLAMYALFHSGGHTSFRLMASAMVVGEYLAIVYFHYSAALISKSLHTIYAPFMAILARRSCQQLVARFRLKSLRFQLTTALHVQAFHVKRRYGITYASFGLVSLSAFARVSQSNCMLDDWGTNP